MFKKNASIFLSKTDLCLKISEKAFWMPDKAQDIAGHRLVPQGFLWLLMFLGFLIFCRVPQSSSGFLRIPYDSSEFLRTPNSSLWLPVVPKGSLSFLRVPKGSLFSLASLLSNFTQVGCVLSQLFKLLLFSLFTTLLPSKKAT